MEPTEFSAKHAIAQAEDVLFLGDLQRETARIISVHLRHAMNHYLTDPSCDNYDAVEELMLDHRDIVNNRLTDELDLSW
jgi:hypothetical protein